MPRVATRLSAADHLGTVGARTGFTRNSYRITPGLYCVGAPDATAPVLVTANYKLTFDSLRRELGGIAAWILVIDTRGINVWCAAGKKTFSAEEIAFQVNRADLDRVVGHRELILPQLAASGVAARELKRLCGFSGRFGPIKAADLPVFLKTGQADETMRTVTFTTAERLVLIPVELCLLWKRLGAVCLLGFLLSGISPQLFSWTAAVERGTVLTLATLTSVITGAALTPLLLPWLPFRQFWLKGLVTGGLGALLFLMIATGPANGFEKLGLVLWIGACSAYLAMNFTGSTPFTSLSGVEKELRRGLPVQLGGAVLAMLCWLAAPFT